MIELSQEQQKEIISKMRILRQKDPEMHDYCLKILEKNYCRKAFEPYQK